MGVTVNGVMVRNLSLTLEGIVESTAKMIAAQEKSSDSMDKVLLDKNILIFLLSRKESMLWPTPPIALG